MNARLFRRIARGAVEAMPLTHAQVAEEIDSTPAGVLRLIRSGRLAGYEHGGLVFVAPDALERFKAGAR